MTTRISAIYRDGVFVPEDILPLANETAVELLIEEPDSSVMDSLSVSQRQQLRIAVANSMRRRRLAVDAPRFTRDELHDRR